MNKLLAIALLSVLGGCASGAPSKYCLGSLFAVGDFVGGDMTQKVLTIDGIEDHKSKTVVAWWYHTTTGDNMQLNLNHVSKNTWDYGVDKGVNWLSAGGPHLDDLQTAEHELVERYYAEDLDHVKMPIEFVRIHNGTVKKWIVVKCPAKAPE